MTKSILVGVGLSLFWLCANVSQSSASAPATLGFDADTTAQATAVSDGRTLGVTFSNPALLVDVEPYAMVGLITTVPHLAIRLRERPRGVDVPISIYDSDLGTAAVKDRSLPTVELPALRRDRVLTTPEGRVGVGFVHDFGLPHFRLGVIAVGGGGNAANVSTHYDDERSANFDNQLHFTRFGEWDRVVSLLVGAGLRIHPKIALGISTELGAVARAKVSVYIPDASVQDYAQSNLETDVALRFRPILGIAAYPTENWTLGATFRGQSAFQVDGGSGVTLWNYHEPGTGKTIPKRTLQVFPITFGFQPLEVAIGVSYRTGILTARLGATFQRWSRYVDAHGDAPEDLATVTSKERADDFRFKDVIVTQGGFTIRYAKGFEATLGLGYLPSPVPAQIGRTNFVDGDIFSVSIGHRVDMVLAKRKFGLSATVSGYKMASHTVSKDPSLMVDEMGDNLKTLRSGSKMPEAQGLQTNNPGFPGYTSGGTFYVVSVTVSHAY